MNRQQFEDQLAQLPLYTYAFFDPARLEFSQRIRWICENECPMYGRSWACPPGVGCVEACRKKCKDYANCLMIASITEVADIADIYETLATRPEHEALTNHVRELFRAQGIEPFILSTEACSVCDRCAYLDGEPCRFPSRMHPCVESHGINVIPTLEECGIEFQFGSNIVTWISLLFFTEQ